LRFQARGPLILKILAWEPSSAQPAKEVQSMMKEQALLW